MFCNQCGNKLNGDEKICPKCGAVVEALEVQMNLQNTQSEVIQPPITSSPVTPSQPVAQQAPVVATKNKTKAINALTLIGNILGIISGIVSTVFGIMIKAKHFTSYGALYETAKSYGGDAYTGIQQAAAQTADNVLAIFRLIQNSMCFLLIAIGLIAISAFTVKLFAYLENKNNK